MKGPVLILLLSVYVLSRAVLLDTEFTYEEPLWVKAGIHLWKTGSFTLDAGLVDRAMSAFSKPPLLSILLGLAHEVFGHSNAAYRIVPFILGLFTFFVALMCVRELRGNVVAFGVLFIFTPFLLVGMNQIQTDGSVGVFGYTLLLYASVRGVRDGSRAEILIFAAGLWLALAKTEIFLLGVPGLAIAASVGGRWRRLLRYMVIYIVSFIPGALLIAGLSLYTFGNLNGFFEVYYTVLRIVGGIIVQKVHTVEIVQGFKSSLVVWEQIRFWHLPIVIFAAIVAIILALMSRRRIEVFPQCLTLATFILVPTLAYIGLGYVGDGFPRYFLIVIPASLVAITSLRSFLPWQRLLPVGVTIYTLVFGVQIGMIYRSNVSWTGFRGNGGFQNTGVFLAYSLPKDAPILGPDPVGYYYGGPFYDVSLIQPYPERWGKMLESDYKNLRAWVYFPDPLSGKPGDPGQRRFYEILDEECRIDRRLRIGTLGIALLTEPHC